MADTSCRYGCKIWKAFSAVCWLWCFGFAMALPQHGMAQTEGTLRGGLDRQSFLETTQGTWNIDAATITYDQNTQVYEAEGNVRVISGDRSIQADRALLDAQKRQVELWGNVRLQYGKDWLQGEHVMWNLDEETGWVDGGIVFFAENHFYAQGRSIAKTGPNQYELKEGFLTSCDPANADWKVRYEEMRVNLEGIAWAKHTSFWVRSLPLLYTPLVALPVQQRRQSGFLLPWGGFSDLSGFEAELPFYWAMRDDMDLTLYGRYMEKRGFMSGLEYRINNPTWGEGVWLFNYLSDEADRALLEREGYPFETTDRFWLRSRHSFTLPYGIEGRLDTDVVSDRNFLNEFERGSTSWDHSNGVFRDVFGRGILNDETYPARESSLYLSQAHESSLLSLDARYWQQTDRAIDEFTTQRLPVLSFNVIPSWVNDLPFYYTMESSLANFWRREGDRGGRLDVYPRVHYPLHWNSYLDAEPSVGVRTNAYSVDWTEEGEDEWQGRLLSDVRLELSSRVNRVYPVNWKGMVALQHSIRPEITYEYIPQAIGGDNLPRFDRLDEDQSRHDVRYGLSTFLTSKEVQTDAEGNSVTSYRELARLKVFQAYNIEPSPQDLQDLRLVRARDLDPAFEEGWVDFGLRLDVMPKRYVTFSYDGDFDTDEGTGTNHDVFMTLDSGRGHLFRLNYHYWNNLPINEVITEVSLKVLPSIYLNTYHDYSIERTEMYSHGYGVRYVSGCWAIGVAYEKEDNDQRVSVSLNLLGLGTIQGSYALGGSETVAGTR